MPERQGAQLPVVLGATGLVALVHLAIQSVWWAPVPSGFEWASGLAVEALLVLGLAGALALAAARVGATAVAVVSAALVVGLQLPRWFAGQGTDGKARTVVLITVDTLRRDYVSAYPGAVAEGLTPAIDGLLSEGIRFDGALTQSPQTLPSHMAMLSGVDPWTSGAVQNGRPVPVYPLVTEQLAADGFSAAAFVSSGVLDRGLGLERGFDAYSQPAPLSSWARLPLAGAVGAVLRPEMDLPVERAGAETVDAALDWVRLQPADASVFLWVHLYEPHAPYLSPEQEPVDAWEQLGHPCDWSAHPSALGRGGALAMRAMVEPLPEVGACRARDWRAVRARMSQYGAEVRAADAAVGSLIAGLRAAGRWERAGVVFASDHGENLVEQQALPGHQFWLSEAVTRVALSVRDPGCADCPGSVREDPVALTQVASTLRQLAGLSAVVPLQGPGPSHAVSITTSPIPAAGIEGPSFQVAASDGRAKVIVDESGQIHRYWLPEDPGERTPLVSADEALAARRWVDSVARAWADGRPGPGVPPLAPPQELSAQIVEALEQRGVVGTVVDPSELAVFAESERLARSALDRVATRRLEVELNPGQDGMLRVLGYVP